MEDFFKFLIIIFLFGLVIISNPPKTNFEKLNSGQISEQEYCQEYKDYSTQRTPNRCLKYFINPNKQYVL